MYFTDVLGGERGGYTLKRDVKKTSVQAFSIYVVSLELQHADRIVVKGGGRALPCPFPKIVLLSDHHWFDSVILIK